MTTDFSSETMQIRGEQINIFKLQEENNYYQPKSLNPAKISFKLKTNIATPEKLGSF